MNTSKIFISAFVVLLSSSVFGQTQVPNTFQSGQPARAAEVNANFSELENAVNQNASDIVANTASIQAIGSPRVLDGGDNEIGRLISIGENHWSIEVITQQGYLITVSTRDGKINTGLLFFASFDCTGTPHIDSTFFGGYVAITYDVTGVPGLSYIDKNSVPLTNFLSNSFIFGAGGCSVATSGGTTVFPILPNDPTVTGVSTDTYQLPIKIQPAQ
jgi:hypothetical protein